MIVDEIVEAIMTEVDKRTKRLSDSDYLNVLDEIIDICGNRASAKRME